MLELNSTYLKAGWKVDKVHNPRSTVSAIIKGTWDLRNGLPATPSETQMEIGGDLYLDDDPAGNMIYSSDFAPFKPRADFLVAGHAWAPAERPVASLSVSASIGSITKRLLVTGNRYWISDYLPSNPEPFSKMELSYQNAFGGTGFERNPMGKGYSEVELPNGARFWPCPNIEQPGYEVNRRGALPEPAGLAPLPFMWPQRRSKSGTYDEAWRRHRWPSMPVDFDYGFFNAAPADQQLPYLRGDERLRFENLRPGLPVYESALPGTRVRCFYADVIGAPISFSEVSMALDTVWVDIDAEKLVLVWRGVADLRTDKAGTRDWLVVGIENLAETPKPQKHYEDYALGAARALDKAELPPMLESDTPDAVSDPTAIPQDTEPATVESCLDDYARGRSFEGRDLTGVDLSSANFEAADFHNAILSGALFRHARLAGANFTGAILAGADFAGADLRKAILSRADLTGARLVGAQLKEAHLTRSDFTRAILREADLEAARGDQAIFQKADLFRTVFRRATLKKADFGRAELHEADFSDAVLAGASMEDAVAYPVLAPRADITGLRATGAVLWSSDFTDCRGAGSIWQGANLRDTLFSRSDLTGATFDGADLLRADLSHAVLRHARLAGASMESAVFLCADLFDASLEQANLAHTSFRGASLFGAKSLECLLRDTDFAGADLKHTLFEVQP